MLSTFVRLLLIGLVASMIVYDWWSNDPRRYFSAFTDVVDGTVVTSETVLLERKEKGSKRTRPTPVWQFAARYSVDDVVYVTTEYSPDRERRWDSATAMQSIYPVNSRVRLSYVKSNPGKAWVEQSAVPYFLFLKHFFYATMCAWFVFFSYLR